MCLRHFEPWCTSSNVRRLLCSAWRCSAILPMALGDKISGENYKKSHNSQPYMGMQNVLKSLYLVTLLLNTERN